MFNFMKPSTTTPKRPPRRLQRLVGRTVEFEILVPPLAPGQKMLRRKVPVQVVGKLEVLTPESMQRIDTRKMQLMIHRLYDTVRELTGYSAPNDQAHARPNNP